eukprot:6213574-Pleurochrysis_carterae.AAC.2
MLPSTFSHAARPPPHRSSMMIDAFRETRSRPHRHASASSSRSSLFVVLAHRSTYDSTTTPDGVTARDAVANNGTICAAADGYTQSAARITSNGGDVRASSVQLPQRRRRNVGRARAESREASIP